MSNIRIQYVRESQLDNEPTKPEQDASLASPIAPPEPLSIQDYAQIFKALANPHRLSIFRRLAKAQGKELYVGELGKELDLAPSTVSHHLKELSRAGLIHAQRQRQNIACSVKPGALEALASLPSFFAGDS